MSIRRLPSEAFNAYVDLGPDRSYTALAEKFGVAKRTVVTRAKSEHWQERLVDAERKARQIADQKAVESLEEMNERHLKSVRLIQAKAIEILVRMPLDSASSAARALATAIEQERVIRGEPSDRSAIDVAAIIKREYETFVIPKGAEEDWGDARPRH